MMDVEIGYLGSPKLGYFGLVYNSECIKNVNILGKCTYNLKSAIMFPKEDGIDAPLKLLLSSWLYQKNVNKKRLQLPSFIKITIMTIQKYIFIEN